MSSVQDIDALVTTFVLLIDLLFSLSLLVLNIALIPSEIIFGAHISLQIGSVNMKSLINAYVIFGCLIYFYLIYSCIVQYNIHLK